ncbi:MAG TPA: hypothetical protein VIK56_15060 [Rhodoferax sp.]
MRALHHHPPGTSRTLQNWHDHLASLKKTCRKLGISFWLYLLDRVSLTNTIPPLPTLIRNAAMVGALP